MVFGVGEVFIGGCGRFGEGLGRSWVAFFGEALDRRRSGDALKRPWRGPGEALERPWGGPLNKPQ